MNEHRIERLKCREQVESIKRLLDSEQPLEDDDGRAWASGYIDALLAQNVINHEQHNDLIMWLA